MIEMFDIRKDFESSAILFDEFQKYMNLDGSFEYIPGTGYMDNAVDSAWRIYLFGFQYGKKHFDKEILIDED